MTDNIKAYLAGLADGEGCITARKYKHRGNVIDPVFRIEMTNRVPIEMFSQYFGGNVYTHIRKEANRKISYSHYSSGTRAKAIIEQLLPYLKVKKSQGEMAIQIMNLKKNKIQHSEKMEGLFNGIRRLNHA